MSMESRSTTIDVLLYQEDPIALSILRILQKYPDVTVFTRETIGDIIPDLIIFTENDPYHCVQVLRGIPVAYRAARPVYVRNTFDAVAIGLMQYVGVMSLLSTSLNSDEFYSCLKTIGISPVTGLTKKKVTKFYNNYYRDLQQFGLTFKQSMALAAGVRGYSWNKLYTLLGMNKKRFLLERNKARKLAGLNGIPLQNIPNIIKYGGVTPGPLVKQYNIPKRLLIKPEYYLIPHFTEEPKKED